MGPQDDSLYWDSISAFDEFDPIFEETIGRALSEWPIPAGIGMNTPFEVIEIQGGWEIQATIPGLSPEDVFITLEGNQLKIQGVLRVQETEPLNPGYHKEREKGKFYRSIPLPDGVDPRSIYTCFENGVLIIRLEP